MNLKTVKKKKPTLTVLQGLFSISEEKRDRLWHFLGLNIEYSLNQIGTHPTQLLGIWLIDKYLTGQEYQRI